jgi:hypothetical protein
MRGGHWGRGLIPRDLRVSPAVDEALGLKLQHRLVLELLVDYFTGSNTETMDFFLLTHTGSYKNLWPDSVVYPF